MSKSADSELQDFAEFRKQYEDITTWFHCP